MRRRTNLLWGVMALAAALIVLAQALGAIPNGMADMLLRAWPALLVLAGLSLVLRQRVPFSDIFALIGSVVVAAVIISSAYAARATTQRTDFQQPISQTLGGGLTLLRLRVQTLATDVDLVSASASAVTGEFVGSRDNQIEVSYVEAADSSATLTLHEVQQTGAFPMLATMGRGKLHLELPPNIPLDVEFVGQNGSTVLNLGGTALERLNITSVHGSAVVTLPEYKPLLSQPTDSLGTLTIGDGDLALLIPAAVGARLELDRGGSGIDPQYDANVYNYLVGDVLEAKNINTASIIMHYTLRVPHGKIRLEAPKLAS